MTESGEHRDCVTRPSVSGGRGIGCWCPRACCGKSLVVETRVLDDDASKVVLAEDEEVIEQLSAQRARQGPSVPGEEIGSALGSCTPDLVTGPIVLNSAAVTSRAHDPDCHRWVHIGAFDARLRRIEFWPTTEGLASSRGCRSPTRWRGATRRARAPPPAHWMPNRAAHTRRDRATAGSRPRSAECRGTAATG